jgi:hypothetical protein
MSQELFGSVDFSGEDPPRPEVKGVQLLLPLSAAARGSDPYGDNIVVDTETCQCFCDPITDQHFKYSIASNSSPGQLLAIHRLLAPLASSANPTP